ncbi:ABC transporter permease [Halobaculum sp. EA56]|uniref:ABC transporter permease n=1 Tax=Halobaculum sp. EA56 TaxID=3421648 RepID=UPI003EBB38F2
MPSDRDDGSPAPDADAPRRFARDGHGGPVVRGFGDDDRATVGSDDGSPATEARDGEAVGRVGRGPRADGPGTDEADRAEGLRSALPARHTLAMAALGLALVAVFLYDVFVVHVYLVESWEWDPTRSDWLFLASLWLLATLATRVVPNRALAERYWSRIRDDGGAMAALAVLGAFFVVGLVGPLAVGSPQSRFLLGGQPPPLLSVDANAVANCAGTVSAGRCWGSLAYPLGTDTYGYGVATLLVAGTRLALYVAVITAAIVVPVGALVGATAGFYGGRVDRVLSRYIDVQQTIPAVVAYVVLVLVIEKSLFMLVLVFGLFSWGGVARVVRAETRQRRDAEYVRAAEGLGGTRRYRLRRHVLPNVSHGVVTAFGQQVPLLLVTEAAIAYLDLNAIDQPSWGALIANGVDSGVVAQWWVAGAGVAALAGTTLAFKLAADALRDALDPTG